MSPSTHSTPPAITALTGELSHFQNGKLLCTTADFEQFVISEEDAVKACYRAHTAEQNLKAVQDNFELTVRRIEAWCRSHPRVMACGISLRSDDILVAVCATDEDRAGDLHDDMAALDLDLFDRTNFALSFMLFRLSEVAGLDAFVQPKTRIIYLNNASPIGTPAGRA